MHRQMMGLPRQPALGRMLAPQLICRQSCVRTWEDCPRQAAPIRLIYYVRLYRYADLWRDAVAGLGSLPQAGCCPYFRA